MLTSCSSDVRKKSYGVFRDFLTFMCSKYHMQVYLTKINSFKFSKEKGAFNSLRKRVGV